LKSPAKNNNLFLSLTWFDLESWAGRKVLSRGKSYQRSGYVEDLGITAENELVAWVQGTKPYATEVGFKRGKLSSSCTCPYGVNCKHGVALVIEYLDRVKNKKEIPIISSDDKRLKLIKSGHRDLPDDYEDNFDDSEDGNDASDDGKSESPGNIGTFLKNKSKDDLAAILSEITERHPEIKDELLFKANMSSKSVDSLVKTIKREINRVSDEPGWYDYRRHTGHTPDYSSVKSGLNKLVESGKADEAIKLGEFLLKKGIEQIEQSNDENETVDAVADAMAAVCGALKASSLPNADKMEKAINLEMGDGYGLCNLDEFWKKRFAKNDWSILADRLLERLKDFKTETRDKEFQSSYYRDKFTDKIIKALANAGRNDETIHLSKQEASKTGSFNRVVKLLRDGGKQEEAEEWIRKGIAATDKNKHGIIGGLVKHLLEIRTEKRDWLFVAAIKAIDFFDRPSLETFKELLKSAERAKVKKPVEDAAMNFLRTGKKPRSKSAEWPLPETGLEKSEEYRISHNPYTSVLVDIALFDKNIDEALLLYDKELNGKHQKDYIGSTWSNAMHGKVAEAIKEKYQDRAVEIWKYLAEHHIGFSNPQSYTQAAHYLRKVQKTLEAAKKSTEWKQYLAVLRAENKRKTRLMEILDSITGKTIIEG